MPTAEKSLLGEGLGTNKTGTVTSLTEGGAWVQIPYDTRRYFASRSVLGGNRLRVGQEVDFRLSNQPPFEICLIRRSSSRKGERERIRERLDRRLGQRSVAC